MYCPGGYRLYANPSTETMLLNVEEKASPLAGRRRELVNVLWRERGPNWHERLLCAAITLNKPDFHAEYDEAKRVWTASWKWSGDQPPVSLKNRL